MATDQNPADTQNEKTTTAERIASKSTVAGKADNRFRHSMTMPTRAKGKAGSAEQHAANARFVRSLAIQRGLRAQPSADVVIESVHNNRDGTSTYVYALLVFLAGTDDARTSPDEQIGLPR